MSTASSRLSERVTPSSLSGTRVVAVGTCDGFPELLMELGAGEGIELIARGHGVQDVAEQLEDAATEAVLYATSGGRGWTHELTAIRGHTKAPIVLVTSGRSDALLEQALDADVASALVLPQLVENVTFAVQRAARDGREEPPEAVSDQGQARVVTVYSPKGGTGKTVISTNLAASFAAKGLRTLLIDLDLQFGDAAIMLGLKPEKTLHDLVTGPGELAPEKLSGYTTQVPDSELAVLAAPLRPQDADLVGDAKIAGLLEVARSSFDVIVVDSSPHLHGPILTALDQTNHLVLVCGPEVPALKNMHLTLETLTLLGFPRDRIRLVLNHAHQNGGLSCGEMEDALGDKVVCELPNDRSVPQGVNRGIPAVELQGRSEFAKALNRLATTLTDDEVASRPRRRLIRLGRSR